MQEHEEVLKFWFVEHTGEDWFGGKPEFDEKLRGRFFRLHGRVALGEAWSWRVSAQGRLAEILVLDQFSRQFYRGDPRAFASDGMALVLAQELVASGQDKTLSESERLFAYMPYMHSESLLVHEEAVRLFTALGNEDNLKFEISHRDTIERFGRFPKRNEALGRVSTQEELAYINERKDSMF
ncbi:MAG TPA: DUF924 domain-containing protein [Devosia sp.]|nr:DUF924 domain-containing protein [Devosia sp.]